MPWVITYGDPILGRMNTHGSHLPCSPAVPLVLTTTAMWEHLFKDFCLKGDPEGNQSLPEEHNPNVGNKERYVLKPPQAGSQRQCASFEAFRLGRQHYCHLRDPAFDTYPCTGGRHFSIEPTYQTMETPRAFEVSIFPGFAARGGACWLQEGSLGELLGDLQQPGPQFV